MNLELAGIPFEIGPSDRLSTPEREAVARLQRHASGIECSEPQSRPFRLEIVPEPPWSEWRPEDHLPGEPASVQWRPPTIRVAHTRFAAELDIENRAGRVYRMTRRSFALEISVRSALCAMLPSFGGVPLHAAGVHTPHGGLVFFGPSGAGKSTIAACSPYPVLSDELVAVLGHPPHLASSGFWGEFGDGAHSPHADRLAALVELRKGPRTILEPLAPQEIVRRLVNVILVPPSEALWTPVLAVLGRLATEVPVWRLTWSPASPPWAEIAAAVANQPLVPSPARFRSTICEVRP